MRVTKNKNDDRIYVIYAMVIFFIMYVFFTTVKPIMVCDPDDWTYIGTIRKAFPIWKAWNPAKVMPETLEGFLGYFSAYVIYPLCGDYIRSFTYVFAFFVALMIALFIVSIALLLDKCLSIGRGIAVLSSFITFLLHFLVLKGTMFLFTASNLNCFMNYLVPLLFSIMLFMGFMIKGSTYGEDGFLYKNKCRTIIDILRTGSILLLIYLSVFSNMVCNVALIVPMALSFLYRTIKDLKRIGYRKMLSKEYLMQDLFYIVTFVLEAICLIFEYNGGRAGSFHTDIYTALSETKEDLIYIVQHLNRVLILIMLFVFLSASIMCIKDKNHKCLKIKILLVLSCALTDIYMALLYTKIGEHKLQRCENIFVMMIFAMLAFSVAFGYLIDCWKKILMIMPIALYILGSLVLSRDYKASISYYAGDRALCYAVDTNIVSQYVQAEREGKIEFDLHVPRSGLGSYSFTADRISSTLYRHGITNKRLKANMIFEDDTYFTK